MKITFGIIVLNGDFFLKQLLDSIYPFAHKICIAEGSVGYWAQKGINTSTDATNLILKTYPDPDKKLAVVHGTWPEKTEMCQAWFKNVPEDTDYIWACDADELFTNNNIHKMIGYLKKWSPSRVAFRSCSFFGGFDRIIGGFERAAEFKRVLKYIPGSVFANHRPPTLLKDGANPPGKDVSGHELLLETGIEMWHGSYVSPKAVYEKYQYYRDSVIKKGHCIPDWFNKVFLAWCLNPKERAQIEQKYMGVHEFLYPVARSAAFTQPFVGEHPEVIKENYDLLISRFNSQLKQFL